MADSPVIPPLVRDWCYALGTLLGLGIAPALVAMGLPTWAGVAAALAGAADAIAWGYRPTRQTAVDVDQPA